MLSKSFLLSTVSNKIKKGVGIDYEVVSSIQDNVEYINYKYTNKLPFKDKTFDKILLLAVLEHINLDEVNSLFLEFLQTLINLKDLMVSINFKYFNYLK